MSIRNILAPAERLLFPKLNFWTGNIPCCCPAEEGTIAALPSTGNFNVWNVTPGDADFGEITAGSCSLSGTGAGNRGDIDADGIIWSILEISSAFVSVTKFDTIGCTKTAAVTVGAMGSAAEAMRGITWDRSNNDILFVTTETTTAPDEQTLRLYSFPLPLATSSLSLVWTQVLKTDWGSTYANLRPADIAQRNDDTLWVIGGTNAAGTASRLFQINPSTGALITDVGTGPWDTSSSLNARPASFDNANRLLVLDRFDHTTYHVSTGDASSLESDTSTLKNGELAGGIIRT